MTNSTNSDPEVLPARESPSDSALALLESPLSGLTPAQRELRRMVLDSVPAPSSKLAYGQALDHLFGFSAGRPLSRALLMEWRASHGRLAPSTVNVRLSAVRKLVV